MTIRPNPPPQSLADTASPSRHCPTPNSPSPPLSDQPLITPLSHIAPTPVVLFSRFLPQIFSQLFLSAVSAPIPAFVAVSLGCSSLLGFLFCFSTTSTHQRQSRPLVHYHGQDLWTHKGIRFPHSSCSRSQHPTRSHNTFYANEKQLLVTRVSLKHWLWEVAIPVVTLVVGGNLVKGLKGFGISFSIVFGIAAFR